MKAISAAQIQEFVNGFAGASKSQINNVIGTLKAIFASACGRGDRARSHGRAHPAPGLQRGPGAGATPRGPGACWNVRTHGGLFLAILYYLGVRRGEALGLKWGDFDFAADQVHILRDIDFTGSTSSEGSLKTAAADRFIPSGGSQNASSKAGIGGRLCIPHAVGRAASLRPATSACGRG